MKNIGAILLTYFQLGFAFTVGLLLAIGAWLAATLHTMTHPAGSTGSEPLWPAFLFSLFYILMASGINLKRLVITNTGALFPRYRTMHLMALGLLMTVFLVWPIVILGIQGYPVLKTSAFFLFLSVMVLWGAFYFGENGLAIVSIAFLGKTMYDMLGFESPFILVPSLADLSLFGSTAAFGLLVIVVSLVLLGGFSYYFLTVSVHKIPKSSRVQAGSSSIHSVGYDRANGFMATMAGGSIARLIRKLYEGGKRDSLLSRARLIQPALFSPKFAFVTHGLISALVYFVTVAAAAAIYLKMGSLLERYTPGQLVPILLIFYLVSSGAASLDFLQHRHRLPALWIVTGSNSRKQFAMTTFTSYMMVAGKQYSVTSMGLLLVPVFFTDIYYFQVIPLIVLGLPLFIFMVSLSILVGSEVRSPDCRGWQWITGWGGGVFGAILLLETKVSFRDSLFTWYFIAALLALSLVLLWRAYKAWIDYEMDYVGPEFYSPGF